MTKLPAALEKNLAERLENGPSAPKILCETYAHGYRACWADVQVLVKALEWIKKGGVDDDSKDDWASDVYERKARQALAEIGVGEK